MTSYLTLVQVYIAGGLTFIPLVLLAIFVHGYLTFPYVETKETDSRYARDDLRDAADDNKNIISGASSIAENLRKDRDKDVAEGYYAVCREYVPGGVNGKPPIRTTPAGEVIAQESPSVYQNMYRSIFERRQGSTLDPSKADGVKSIKRARNIFYVVLRHGHLMLYDDSEQVEVKHVISLAHHDISIFGGGHEIPEGELWIKRNAICLKRKASTLDKGSSSLPFFFFSEDCSQKEDFYFALLRSQAKLNHEGPSLPLVQDFDVKDIVSLVQRLHSTEEHLQTRWLNALIGRLFLALYKTKFAENYIRAKITKKISRVKKPAILSGIILRDIDMGRAAPLITNPRLRDLTVDGEFCAEVHVSYEGGFRLEIGATARIELGQRFKAREVTLVLAVVVKKLEGKLLIRMKPPPSNRIWISFETMPVFEFNVEPIVSSRHITYSLVLRAIESRIREVFAETLVSPHWDDSPFYETLDQIFRGGIWAQSSDSPGEETEIPDDDVQDEAETHSEEVSSLKNIDERTQSMPQLSNLEPGGDKSGGHKATSSVTSMDEKNSSHTTQKISEKPKVLRTSSFAAAADPVVSTDSVSGDPGKESARKSPPSKDAASYISEINNRSQPSSLIATPIGRRADTLTNPDLTGSHSSTSSIMDSIEENFGISQNSIASQDVRIRNEIGKGSSQAKASKDLNEATHHTKLQGLAKTLTPSDKKQQAVLAAAVAAKNWGWNTFNKKQRLTAGVGIRSERAGVPETPMGRGRPLPPPGVPLPGPEGKRASLISLGLPKRKPVPTSSTSEQNKLNLQTTKPSQPTREQRRASSLSETKITAAQMLVVKAPSDSESGSPSPTDDYGEFMDNVTVDDEEAAAMKESLFESDGFQHDIESSRSPTRRRISSQMSSSYEDEDSHGLDSWKIAQEGEARQRNLWMNVHEHEQ